MNGHIKILRGDVNIQYKECQAEYTWILEYCRKNIVSDYP